MKRIVILISGIFILGSCRNYSDSKNRFNLDSMRVSDSIRLSDSTGGSIRDTTKVYPPPPDTNFLKIDTAITQPPSKDKEKKYGVLGYSYFKAMRQNETRNISAYVSIINSVKKVIDTLKEINSEDLPVRANDTASVFTQNIALYKYLDITLVDPDGDFSITQVHDNSRQEVDSLGSAFWSWAVTPKTKKSQARLILKVVAEKQDGSHEPFKTRNIVINIGLDRGIFRIIYTWLFENPDKALVIVIIPLIIFFRKQIAALFKRKPKP